MFIDRVTIFVKGGDGGRGCLSFRREKYVPKGGPDGGDGGDGGSVILRAVAGTDSLAEIVNRKHWKAPKGGPGKGANKHGRKAPDLVIPVPPGTVVYDRDRGHILRDLSEAGQEVIVGQGGRGGRGNRAFMSSTNQAPRETQPGVPGEERWLMLELKVIADAGLIGLPNAGKSTLLSRLSQAHPEIADYPFTTKHPNLGTVQIGGERTIVLADLPGLIEGAHEGIGLGHEFLRHVERTRVVVHLVEPMPSDDSDPVANYRTVRRELELHGRALSAKPEIVALSKCELTGSEEIRARLEKELGREVIAFSAVTGQGMGDLVRGRDEQPAGNRGTSGTVATLADIRGEPFVNADVVVDVGNTRIKWGRCRNGAVVEMAYLSSEADHWLEQVQTWFLPPATTFVIAGPRPDVRDHLASWLDQHAFRVRTLLSFNDLPIQVKVDAPSKVGIDRLLNALAARTNQQPERGAVVIGAGTAVTVDLIDAEGVFRGGAIFPGIRLMAKSLHDYTALLPEVEIDSAVTPPGTSTELAISCGIVHAVAGGIEKLICEYRRCGQIDVFLTGGDGPLLASILSEKCRLWPEMTLEGLRLAALSLNEK